jgi:cholesterol oxidase
MNTQLAKTTFEFTEEMKSYLSQKGYVFEDGYNKGKQGWHHFMFYLTIRTDGLDAFVSEDALECAAMGYVESDLVGGRCSVEKGKCNLLVDSVDKNRRQMKYHLFITTTEGKKLTLSGVKQIQDNLWLDVWKDTTTLFINLYSGHIEATKESKAKTYATGILYIEAPDFAVQLTTFKTNADTLQAKALAFEKFGTFFLGSLWDVYKPKLTTRMDSFERTIPIFTTVGVNNAEITTHPFSTAYKLDLSLLRFKRKTCKDVAVLIPGLIAASDMFIMPENYNLVSYQLDQGFTDVWTMDGCISNRYYYNLLRNDYNVDDLALYYHPAALETVRKTVGDETRVHVISHCFGALFFVMSLFGKATTGVRNVIAMASDLRRTFPSSPN